MQRLAGTTGSGYLHVLTLHVGLLHHTLIKGSVKGKELTWSDDLWESHFLAFGSELAEKERVLVLHLVQGTSQWLQRDENT